MWNFEKGISHWKAVSFDEFFPRFVPVSVTVAVFDLLCDCLITSSDVFGSFAANSRTQCLLNYDLFPGYKLGIGDL